MHDIIEDLVEGFADDVFEPGPLPDGRGISNRRSLGLGDVLGELIRALFFFGVTAWICTRSEGLSSRAR